jgi:hypothetical protein
MAGKGADLNKTWIASGKGTTTFNANSNITIPYGRYKATVYGKGADGNSPAPSSPATYNITYSTNYSVAYPIATQPIANQPATSYITNYNTNYYVAYPIANQPLTGYTSNYNTNYSVAYPVSGYPVAFQPATGFSTNYSVSYPVGTQPIANQPATAFNPTYYYLNWQANVSGIGPPLGPPGVPYSFPFHNTAGPLGPYTYGQLGGFTNVQGNYRYYIIYTAAVASPATASAWTTNYNTNYNVAFAVANQPATAWTTNYNTAYNVAYPVANRPLANQPAVYSTNYSVAYPITSQPIANRPATAWTTNYSTNYNVAYPIANQPETGRPVATYNAVIPGVAGTPANVLGVPFPGGAISTVAANVSATVVSYYSFPDNATYPVTVYPTGSVTIKIE